MKDTEEQVILVDIYDNPLGTMEKMEAHIKAVLHRAFSAFVFNDRGELMLQQRAMHKYHSPGLWANTCCSHPRAGEDVIQAAHRRMVEEMGFDCELTKLFDFVYKAALEHGLSEHEFDHVLVGTYNGEPVINEEEVAAWRWRSMDDIAADLKLIPHEYTIWFRIAFERVYEYIKTIDD
jgi:isopentenyl-diphosphate delta-isomerase